MYRILCYIAIGLTLFSCGVETNQNTETEKATSQAMLDLSQSEDNLDAFVKMRASLDTTEEIVYYWKGRIYSYIDGQRSMPLFDLEAMNIARIKKDSSGYHMLSREAAVYRDVKTGEIMEEWYNPLTKDTVEVIHVWNDPVNQTYALNGRFGPWSVPYEELGPNRISLYSDIFLLYPSPLPKAEYPLNSRSDLYQAGELFQFFVNKDELLDPTTTNVYSEVGWTRISDYLPWMNMGMAEGYLIYQCRGYKMEGDFSALPEEFRTYIKMHHPEFANAPHTYERPNMTSWKYFKKVKEE